MSSHRLSRKNKPVYRFISLCVAASFILTSIVPPQFAQAQQIPTILNLPAPGMMLSPSISFQPAQIKGITIHPENPLQFDFLIDTGDQKFQGAQTEEESKKLIKYFLASLTVPEDEMWVNLSPYEKDRIIPESFGATRMGRDLLAQDYILKQLSASLMYPENELGKKFWQRVYKQAYEKFGTTEIPMNTFNKIWIVPQKATVFVSGNTAYVVESHLKVMLEEDYIALARHSEASVSEAEESKTDSSLRPLASAQNDKMRTVQDDKAAHKLASAIIKEILIPEIEKEVNEGENFAMLRQIFSSAILAAWFKKNLRESLLGQVYVDQNKTKGVEIEDKSDNQKIYNQYVEAFKTGVYNYIKEDYDPATQEVIPRKYFSGGSAMTVGDVFKEVSSVGALSPQAQEALRRSQNPNDILQATTNLAELSGGVDEEDIDGALELGFSGDSQASWIKTRKVTKDNLYTEDSFVDLQLAIERAQRFLQLLNVSDGEDTLTGNTVLYYLEGILNGTLPHVHGKAPELNFLQVSDEDRWLAATKGHEITGHASDRGIVLIEASSFMHELSAFLGFSHPESEALGILRAFFLDQTRYTIDEMLDKSEYDDLFATDLQEQGFVGDKKWNKNFRQTIVDALKRTSAMGKNRNPQLLTNLKSSGWRDFASAEANTDGIVQKPFTGEAQLPIYYFGQYTEGIDSVVPRGNEKMKPVLGGKGANLAGMANDLAVQFDEWLAGEGLSAEERADAAKNFKLRVPPGFTITTEQTKLWNDRGQVMSAELKQTMMASIHYLEDTMGRKLGAEEGMPLLVAVRSGAKESMPGMMDTILNLGLNDKSVLALADATSERFAWDSYRRFLEMYGRTVLDIEEDEKKKNGFKHILEKMIEDRSVASEYDLTTEDYKSLIPLYKSEIARQGKGEVPQGPYEQYFNAVETVMRSSYNERAMVYRKRVGLKLEDTLSAVNVMAMVFGNKNAQSGTGVAFTRNLKSGENVFNLEYNFNAQGEDVVSGRKAGLPFDNFQQTSPAIARNLYLIGQFLEQHFRNVQDIEFTFEHNDTTGETLLYILQTRNAKRTSQSEVRTAVEMANEGLITKEEAVARITPEKLVELLASRFDPEQKASANASGRLVSQNGLDASPGAGVGRIVFDADTAKEWAMRGEAVILVRDETSPEDLGGMVVSQAILTSKGGRTSHAAVVARLLGIPAVVGDGNMVINFQEKEVIFTKADGSKVTFKEGDEISVDGTGEKGHGQIFAGRIESIPSLVMTGLNIDSRNRVESVIRQLRVWMLNGNVSAALRAEYQKNIKDYEAFLKETESDSLSEEEQAFYDQYKQLMVWANEVRADKGGLGVGANAERPLDILAAVMMGAQNFGLIRTEHMFAGDGRELKFQKMIMSDSEQARRAALDELLPLQQADFEQEFLFADGRPVTIRLIDPPLHEFLPHEEKKIQELASALKLDVEVVREKIESLKEENPMFGTRGVRLSILFPEIIEMQVNAILNAVKSVRNSGINVKPEIMVPLIGNVAELKFVKERIEAVAAQQGVARDSFKIGTMIEIVAGTLNIAEIAAEVEFISFGSNDLTQGTLKVSRDDGKEWLQKLVDTGILEHDPFVTLSPEVAAFIKRTVEVARSVNPDIKIGICGEQGVDVTSIRETLAPFGLTYVSGSPRRLPLAVVAAAQEAIKGHEPLAGKASENISDIYTTSQIALPVDAQSILISTEDLVFKQQILTLIQAVLLSVEKEKSESDAAVKEGLRRAREASLSSLVSLLEENLISTLPEASDSKVLSISFPDVALEDLFSESQDVDAKNFHELNPAIGSRGSRAFFLDSASTVYIALAQAIAKAAKARGYEGVNFVLPFIVSPKEVRVIRSGFTFQDKELVPSLDKALASLDTGLNFNFTAVIETPAAVVNAAAIAQETGSVLIDVRRLTEAVWAAFKIDAEKSFVKRYVQEGLWVGNIFDKAPTDVERLVRETIVNIWRENPSTEISLILNPLDDNFNSALVASFGEEGMHTLSERDGSRTVLRLGKLVKEEALGETRPVKFGTSGDRGIIGEDFDTPFAALTSSADDFEPLSVEVLRNPRNIERGLAWLQRNKYIFGGGFGYDIRINDAQSEWEDVAMAAYVIARTMGGSKYLNHQGRGLITSDQRPTSDPIREAWLQGLADEGVDLTTQSEGEIITTGLATRKGLADGYNFVAQITGSHNPFIGNGMKFIYKGLPFFQAQLVELYNDTLNRTGWSETVRQGRVTRQELIAEHIEELARVLPTATTPTSLIADFRGGAAGGVFIGVAGKKGYQVVKMESVDSDLPDEVFNSDKPVLIALNDTPSPRMKAGIWDPSKVEAFNGAQKVQQRIYSDLRFKGKKFAGAVFDGDGDRSALMDEDGKLVMSDRMLINFYQRFILANEEGIRVLNKLGHPVSLALDVRASKIIVDILAGIAQSKGLNLKGEFIAAGFPIHREFVIQELTKIEGLLSQVTDPGEREAVLKLMREYTSAEASGHFFFNVLLPEQFLEKKTVVDDGIAGTFIYMDLVSGLNDYELKGKEVQVGDLTVKTADGILPSLPVTGEVRLENAPSDVLKKQLLAEDILLQFAKDNPNLFTLSLDDLRREIEAARNTPPKRQDMNDPLLLVDGIRVELTNGVWILFRKSNTSAVIVFKAEADSKDKQFELAETMKFLEESIGKVKSSNPDYASLDVSKFRAELALQDRRLAGEEFNAPVGQRGRFETLFRDGNNDRGGWVHRPWELQDDYVQSIEKYNEDLVQQGIEMLGFVGMGGEASIIGPSDNKTISISSTSPGKIKREIAAFLARGGQLEKIVWYVTSKSGSTKETRNNATYLEDLYRQAGLDPTKHIIYVTDPGTGLQNEREALGFKVIPREKTSLAASPTDNVGGRNTLVNHSTLTAFAWRNPGQLAQMVEAIKKHHTFEDKSQNSWVVAAQAASSLIREGKRPKLAIIQPEGMRNDLWIWQQQNPEESLGKISDAFTVYTTRPDLKTLEHLKDKGWVFIEMRVKGSEAETEAYADAAAKAGHPVLIISINATLDEFASQVSQYGWMEFVAMVGGFWNVNFSDQPAVEAYKKLMRERNLTLEDAVKPATDSKAALTFSGNQLLVDGLLNQLSPADFATINGMIAKEEPPAKIFASILSMTGQTFDALTLAYYDDVDGSTVNWLEELTQDILHKQLGYAAKWGEGTGVLHGLFVNWFSGPKHQIPIQIVASTHEQPDQVYEAGGKILQEGAVAAHLSLVEANRPSAMIVTPGELAETQWEQISQFFTEVGQYYSRLTDQRLEKSAEISLAPVPSLAEVRTAAASAQGMRNVKVGDLTLKARTLTDLRTLQLEQNPEKSTLVEPDGNGGYRNVTNREFDERVNRQKAILYAHGVRQHDRVAFLSPNRTEYVTNLFGVLELGAVAAPINNLDFTSKPDALEHMLKETNAKFIVIGNDAASLAVARELKKRIQGLKVFIMDATDKAQLQKDEFDLTDVAAAEQETPAVDIKPEDTSIILFSSGSTAFPKAIPQTHQSAVYNAAASTEARGWKDLFANEDFTVLGGAPLYHVIGLNFTLFNALYSGTKYAVPADPKNPAASIVPSKANAVYVVPEVAERLIGAATANEKIMAVLKGLKVFMSGGAPSIEKIADWYIENGISYVNGYGATEVAGAIALGDPSNPDALKLYVIPGMGEQWIKVEGDEEAESNNFELVLNSPTITPGYLDEAINEEKLKADGFHIGDVFERQSDGSIIFKGRNDDRITLKKGEKFAPLPIEQELMNNEAITRAMIVGDASRSYPIALIEPNYSGVSLKGKQWAEIESILWQAFEKANANSPKYAEIRRENIVILKHGEIIPTKKGAVSRNQALAEYAQDIEETYAQKELAAARKTARTERAAEVRVETDNLRDIVKRTDHLSVLVGLVETFNQTDAVTVTGKTLNVAQLMAAAQRGVPVGLSDDEAIRAGVDASVKFLADVLEGGAHVYGVTSGFGGSADVRTRQTEILQKELIRFLNAGFGDQLPDDVVRAAMIIRANSNVKGASGLRWNVLENLTVLLNKGITPVVPKRGSITASGDLVPLSHIMGVLMGKDSARAMYEGREISAKEALEIAGLEPVVLGPKEGLAFVNGTSVGNAYAAKVMYQVNILASLVQAATALSVEGMLGTSESYDPFVQEMKPHPTQIEVARNMRHLLAGSKLAVHEGEDVEEGHLRQDRYDLRTASQWIGPQLDVIMQATEAITIEMNSATDNPLIDTQRGIALHGGNFQGTAVAVPMDNTRLALQALGRILFSQFGIMVNKAFNNGLPANLAGSTNEVDMGLKGMDIAMASYMSELSAIANPVTNHVQSAELHNQGINSLALISARQTARAVKILQMMLASHLYATAQAIDLRNIERGYTTATEEAIKRAVTKTLSAAVENADEVAPWMIEHLIKESRKQPPFAYSPELSAGYRTLFIRLAGEVDDILNNDPKAVERRDPSTGEVARSVDVVLRSDSRAVAGYYRLFKAALARELNELLPRAKEEALQRGASDLLGNTRPIYEFVRRDLGVRFEQADQEPGPELEKIFNALQDGRIVEPLMQAFFSDSEAGLSEPVQPSDSLQKMLQSQPLSEAVRLAIRSIVEIIAESGSREQKQDAFEVFQKMALEGNKDRVVFAKEMLALVLNIGRTDFEYFWTTLQKRLAIKKGGAQKLKIAEIDSRSDEELYAAGENFILTAHLEPGAGSQGSLALALIEADTANVQAANDAVVTLNSMDGGIGESLARLEFLKKHLGRAHMGAKGTDLGYFIDYGVNKNVFVSIAEVKILQVVQIARSGLLGGIKFQPLVNWQSKSSYEEIFNKPSLTNPDMTYRQLLESVGVEVLEMLEQADLPWIDAASETPTFIKEGYIKEGEGKDQVIQLARFSQPGGHGQWGFKFLWETAFETPRTDGKTDIRVFYNGDNTNSRVNPSIIGYMIRDNIPIIKLRTRATRIDKKGGKEGLKLVKVGDDIVRVPGQMEVADAKAAKQEDIFEKAGQAEGENQPFNTNIFYINTTLLSKVLGDIQKIIGAKRLAEIVGPLYIPKAKTGADNSQYIPLDGAIGTAMHNLNEFLMTTTDTRIIEIARQYKVIDSRGRPNLLHFVDIERTKGGFTPVKNPYDIYMQNYTDFYRKPGESTGWLIEEDVPGREMPEIKLEGANKSDKYWTEYQNFVDSFGKNQGIRELQALEIRGRVLLTDALLKGNVTIINESGTTVDLNVHPDTQSLIQDGRLVLDNVEIRIDDGGNLSINKIMPSGSSPSAPATKGGIDLNPMNLDLQIKTDGNGVPLPIEMQPIPPALMKIDGFVPVIINIQPVSLPVILGLADELPERKEADSSIDKEKYGREEKAREEEVLTVSSLL